MSRKASTIAETGRKQSMMPETGRKQSMMPDRKSSIEPPPNRDRRLSVVDSVVGGRRPSIDVRRKPSMVESTTGRSTLIVTSAHGNRPSNVKFENTYKTEPDKKVGSDLIRKVISDLFEAELKDRPYNKEECTALSKRLAESLKQRVKSLGYARYKIVTVVAIGQKQNLNPSVAFTSRSIWNANFDNFSEYTFVNEGLYAVGLVYCLYAE